MQSRIANQRHFRRGAILLLTAFLAVVILGIVAFAVDLGYVVLVRTQLQATADSAALAAAGSMNNNSSDMIAEAQKFASYNTVTGRLAQLNATDVEAGTWDTNTRTFTPSESLGNAVRVTVRTDSTTGGETPLFFGRIFGKESVPLNATAVAMANPREIAFVVDLSGSMNDDTEPCWASNAINSAFASAGYPTIGSEMMQNVYDDFGYGTYPGTSEYLGAPAGVPQNQYAYAELTKDDGYLSGTDVPSQYQIQPTDTESIRKIKAYSWIIDNQIARVMPNAKPAPDSTSNYNYWATYLDYLSLAVTITPPPPPPPPAPPAPPPPPPPPAPGTAGAAVAAPAAPAPQTTVGMVSAKECVTLVCRME